MPFLEVFAIWLCYRGGRRGEAWKTVGVNTLIVDIVQPGFIWLATGDMVRCVSYAAAMPAVLVAAFLIGRRRALGLVPAAGPSPAPQSAASELS